MVGNDNCVSFLNRKLQIPESLLRAHFVEGDGEGASVSRRRARDFPWSALPGPLRQPRPPRSVSPRAADREKKSADPSCRRSPHCARDRQGRFAPLRGGLAQDEAILDRPSARRTLTWQVGSGKWSRQSHQEISTGDTAPPADETGTSGHMMCYQNRTS